MNLIKTKNDMMMFALLVISIMTITAVSPARQAENSNRTLLKIPSQHLNEERSISISLPPEYHKNQKAYPVLYILDAEAENALAQAVDAVKILHSRDIGPQMIIVGIWNTNRNRDMIPASVSHRPGSGGSLQFLKFISEELIPYIKEHFRTTDSSILYGASNAGLFTVYALLERPRTFSGYIAGSPMIGHCPDFIREKADLFIKALEMENRVLYMIYGTGDSPRVLDFVPGFYQDIRINAQKDFSLNLEIIEGQGHVPRDSLIKGLEYFFSEFKTK